MILWAILALMLTVAVSGLTISLLRTRAPISRISTSAVLKAQLDEIDVQFARGQLGADEADRFRAEIKRRALSEGPVVESGFRSFATRGRRILAASVAATCVVLSTALYLTLGRPNLPHSIASASQGSVQRPPASSKALNEVIHALQRRLAGSPSDARAWRLLGWIYLASGRPSEAANAYGRVIAIDPRDAADRSAQGDALVQSASGQVTPAARADFNAALEINPADPRARYFLALFKEQHGDHEGAMRDWISLLKGAPRNAPWLAAVRRFVAGVARAHGENLSAELAAAASAYVAPISSSRLSPPNQRAGRGAPRKQSATAPQR